MILYLTLGYTFWLILCLRVRCFVEEKCYGYRETTKTVLTQQLKIVIFASWTSSKSSKQKQLS